MKRIVPIVLLALVLGAGAASAVSGVSLSGGAFGGVSIPILQDDSKQGVIYGLRLPVSVLPLRWLGTLATALAVVVVLWAALRRAMSGERRITT